jgi:S1-C subfamily serine protease
METLPEKISHVRQSIVAIGFNPNPNQITIVGSGFIVDGKIITCAHLLNNLTSEQINNLKANVMVEQIDRDLERYQWIPVKEYSKDIKNDLAVFVFEAPIEHGNNVTLGNSESVEIGQDVYFIGFPYAAQLINDGFGVTLVVNKGIISNIKRDGTDAEHKRNWFIVDAISNPGNSGCP